MVVFKPPVDGDTDPITCLYIKVFIYARFPEFERSVAHGLWTGP